MKQWHVTVPQPSRFRRATVATDLGTHAGGAGLQAAPSLGCGPRWPARRSQWEALYPRIHRLDRPYACGVSPARLPETPGEWNFFNRLTKIIHAGHAGWSGLQGLSNRRFSLLWTRRKRSQNSLKMRAENTRLMRCYRLQNPLKTPA